MHAFRNAPIRWKLTLIVMLTSGITLLLACAAFVTQEYLALRAARTSELVTLADVISANTAAALVFSDRYSAKEMLAALRAEEHVLAACIYRNDGTMFADYYLRDGVDQNLLPGQPRAPGHYFEGHDLLLFRRIHAGGAPIGTIYIRSDMRVVYSHLKTYAGTGTLFLLASCLFAFLLSSRLQQIVSDPILRLAQAAKAVSAHRDYFGRVEKYSDDELGVLIDAFNEMLERISRRTAELMESEERFRSLFEQAPVPYHEIDTQGIVRRVNAAECRLLGVEAPGVIGRHIAEFVAPEEREEYRETLRQQFSGQHTPVPNQRKYVRHDGRYVIVEMHENLIRNADHETVGIRSALLDITERKRAEEVLSRQAEELARSNAELEQFAYVASHDLQEPLRKIRAFGDRLRLECGAALSDRGRDYLQRMQAAAARMQTLISDLLSLSRVKTRGQPFVRVDLHDLTREVLCDLEARIEQLTARIEVGDLPTIQADPVQMSQLLQNLIGNALKFHRKGQTPLVKIHGERSDAVCRLTVEDNGIGFDEKYVDRIFQVFQRLHGRGEYEGTGVGLAICRRIVERHGGSITARSAPEQGATFIVDLPVQQLTG